MYLIEINVTLSIYGIHTECESAIRFQKYEDGMRISKYIIEDWIPKLVQPSGYIVVMSKVTLTSLSLAKTASTFFPYL